MSEDKSFVEKTKEAKEVLAVIVVFIGILVSFNNWYVELLVDEVSTVIKQDLDVSLTEIKETSIQKESWLLAINEIRLGQVKSDIRYFLDKGLENLSPEDLHEYENRVKDEQKLLSDRNRMLGLE